MLKRKKKIFGFKLVSIIPKTQTNNGNETVWIEQRAESNTASGQSQKCNHLFITLNKSIAVLLLLFLIMKSTKTTFT